MKFNEPLPGPPHKGHAWWAVAAGLFFLIMGTICVLGELGVFRK